MAFASLGTLGANGSTGNNQATLVLTLGATPAAVGELVVIAVAADNLATSASDGNEVASVADSGGNIWNKAIGWSYSAGAAQDGASVSIWYTVVKTAIVATTGTITASFTNANNTDASGIIGWHFSFANRRVSIAATNVAVGAAASSPGSLDATTPNTAALRIRAFGAEVGNNTSLTPTGGGWAAWGNGNSATSGTIAEQVVRAEYLISTGTGAASNPTWAITCDYAHVYVAFVEIPPGTFDEWPDQHFSTANKTYAALRAQGEVWVDYSPTLLTGQDRVYGGPGQVADYDWPNPQNRLGAGAHIALRAEFENTGINVSLFPPPSIAVPYQSRSPLILDGWAPLRLRETAPQQSLLQTTLGVAPLQPPFAETEWPNPRGPQHPVSLRTQISGLPPLPPADTTHITRPPLVLRGWLPPSSISLLTWTDQTKRQLIGQDVFFDGAGRAPVYDWANPRGARPGISLTWTQSLAESLKAPFAQSDWSNPRGYVHGRSLLSWTQSLAESLKPPFAQSDWPNPRRAAQPAPAYTDTLKPWLQITAQPFVQSDWPNPRSKPVIDLTWTQSRFDRPDSFYGLAGAINFDWPNPRGAQYPVALRGFFGPITQPPPAPVVEYTFRAPIVSFSWPQPRPPFDPLNLLTSTLGGPVAPPIRPIDWPNPQRHGPRTAPLHFRPKPGEDVVVAAPPIIPVIWPNPGRIPGALWAQIQPHRVAFIGLDTFFGAPGQVPTHVLPNPRGPLFSIGLRTWIDPLKRFPPPPPPFAETDWPNPRGAIPGISLKTWIDQTKLNLIGQDTFFGAPGETKTYDYPNPRGAERAIDLRTHLDLTKFRLIGADFLPFAEHDWPNPRGFIPSIALKTWTEPLKLNLRGKDQFFGLAGHPNFNWPNPTLPGKFRQEGTIGENRPLYGGGVVVSTADEWIIRARRRGRR